MILSKFSHLGLLMTLSHNIRTSLFSEKQSDVPPDVRKKKYASRSIDTSKPCFPDVHERFLNGRFLSTARLLQSAFALLMWLTSIVILYYVILFIVLAMDGTMLRKIKQIRALLWGGGVKGQRDSKG